MTTRVGVSVDLVDVEREVHAGRFLRWPAWTRSSHPRTTLWFEPSADGWILRVDDGHARRVRRYPFEERVVPRIDRRLEVGPPEPRPAGLHREKDREPGDPIVTSVRPPTSNASAPPCPEYSGGSGRRPHQADLPRRRTVVRPRGERRELTVFYRRRAALASPRPQRASCPSCRPCAASSICLWPSETCRP